MSFEPLSTFADSTAFPHEIQTLSRRARRRKRNLRQLAPDPNLLVQQNFLFESHDAGSSDDSESGSMSSASSSLSFINVNLKGANLNLVNEILHLPSDSSDAGNELELHLTRGKKKSKKKKSKKKKKKKKKKGWDSDDSGSSSSGTSGKSGGNLKTNKDEWNNSSYQYGAGWSEAGLDWSAEKAEKKKSGKVNELKEKLENNRGSRVTVFWACCALCCCCLLCLGLCAGLSYTHIAGSTAESEEKKKPKKDKKRDKKKKNTVTTRKSRGKLNHTNDSDGGSGSDSSSAPEDADGRPDSPKKLEGAAAVESPRGACELSASDLKNEFSKLAGGEIALKPKTLLDELGKSLMKLVPELGELVSNAIKKGEMVVCKFRGKSTSSTTTKKTKSDESESTRTVTSILVGDKEITLSTGENSKKSNPEFKDIILKIEKTSENKVKLIIEKKDAASETVSSEMMIPYKAAGSAKKKGSDGLKSLNLKKTAAAVSHPGSNISEIGNRTNVTTTTTATGSGTMPGAASLSVLPPGTSPIAPLGWPQPVTNMPAPTATPTLKPGFGLPTGINSRIVIPTSKRSPGSKAPVGPLGPSGGQIVTPAASNIPAGESTPETELTAGVTHDGPAVINPELSSQTGMVAASTSPPSSIGLPAPASQEVLGSVSGSPDSVPPVNDIGPSGATGVLTWVPGYNDMMEMGAKVRAAAWARLSAGEADQLSAELEKISERNALRFVTDFCQQISNSPFAVSTSRSSLYECGEGLQAIGNLPKKKLGSGAFGDVSMWDLRSVMHGSEDFDCESRVAVKIFKDSWSVSAEDCLEDEWEQALMLEQTFGVSCLSYVLKYMGPASSSPYLMRFLGRSKNSAKGFIVTELLEAGELYEIVKTESNNFYSDVKLNPSLVSATKYRDRPNPHEQLPVKFINMGIDDLLQLALDLATGGI